ncbi:MAG: M23 family metallopeptidase [Lentimicrobiaceae bacterium]|jgi:murein DD-endopeptidase MepM/ murein hydrolase activator NlpD
MASQKKAIIFFISLVISLSGSLACAQQLAGEPAGGMDENELEKAEMLLPPSNSAVPLTLNIPVLNKYYTSWDTLYVRRYSENPPFAGDSVRLPLLNEYSTGFVAPVEGTFLSPFGKRGRRVHSGVDIKLEAGDPVSAAFDGVVRMARKYSGYGNCVVIRHYNGLETLYGHLSKIKVQVNQRVKAGDIIGLGGHTGRATCNHLHFETRFQGKAFNPKQLINFDTYCLVSDTFSVTKATYGLSRDYLPGNSSTDRLVDDGNSSSKSKSSKSKKYYTIRSGDTLYAVSRKYGTSVKQLCSINGIKPTKKLQLGTKLRIR